MAEETGTSISSQLVIILDTNPVWWGKCGSLGDGQGISLTKCLESVMVFANSHLMMSSLNDLSVIAAHTNKSVMLYPNRTNTSTESSSNDGRYELFCRMNEQIKDEVKTIVLQNMEGAFYSDSLIAGAMAIGLCYLNRIEKENEFKEGTTSSRILVIKGSEDNPEQYMNLMNAVFTAQKQNVVIDACILDNDSGLLQQACDITGGIYLKIPQITGLLQYLLWVFLPDPLERPKLSLPPKVQVDYRAACFCHRNLIDIGYVCSVCLSIFCTFSPICPTCQTSFKFLAPPKMLKKRSKKPPT
ncbi:general transcription factor IIH subunit 3-like isoform X1 [Mytilus galloprovincialis]|uniref:general transcription factor IIH subunit 3-like isoform X1 n=2 Tax=Mytilus galloprovincialis TaxID=29158 RepID=UPI003F7C97C2